jgi:hypothetical protein
MKSLFICICASAFMLSTFQAQDYGFRNFSENDGFDLSNGFDVKLFQKYLTQEMLLAFPWMIEDTTNNFAARATSQQEAGSPMCYGSKQGGMVKTENNELNEAKRIANNYKEYLYNSPFFGEKTLKKYYKDFSAVATKQYGGLIRYGLIVDNNITYESMIGESKAISNTIYKSEIETVDSLVKDHFGDSMKIDPAFEIGCLNYVKEKTENIKIAFEPGQAHYHFSINSADGLPRKSTIIEIINERFNYLESLGLPLTISRYFISVIEEGDQTYLILALDN